MTTTAPERPPTAQENREEKAKEIARLAWRYGLTDADLRALPYASRDRSVRTMTRFAREAYAAAGSDRNPPHGLGSETWNLVAEKLEKMTSRAARGLPVPERDLLHERDLWLPPTDEPRAATQDDVEAEAEELTADEATLTAVPLPRAPEREPEPAAGVSVFDAILGPKCSGCGWRRGFHRPRIGGLAPCSTAGRSS